MKREDVSLTHTVMAATLKCQLLIMWALFKQKSLNYPMSGGFAYTSEYAA